MGKTSGVEETSRVGGKKVIWIVEEISGNREKRRKFGLRLEERRKFGQWRKNLE